MDHAGMHRAGTQSGTAVLSDWPGRLYAAAQSPQLRRALRLPSYILIAGVVGLLLLVATATAPVLFGYHTYIINGGSMEPNLKRGSVAVAAPTSPRALRVGDIIAYHHTPENPPVLHRITKVIDDNGQLSFITQGDSNQTPDSEPVSLQGPGDKVVYSVPYAGYVLSFAESGSGRLGLIGVPLALLLVFFLSENRRAAKPRQQRDAAFGGGEAPAAPAQLRTERAPDLGGAQLPPTAPTPLVLPRTERAMAPVGDPLPAAAVVLARLRAERALDAPGDRVPAAPPPSVAGPFQTERTVESGGDHAPAASPPPVAGPFQTERSQGDLPIFLVRQVQSRGPFEPTTQPVAATSTGEPAGLRSSPSPEWPQRKGNNPVDSVAQSSGSVAQSSHRVKGARGTYPYHDGKHVIVALDLWADGDESGLQQGPPYCLVSGYLASARQWKLFEKDWSEVLKRHDVPDFHASDFFGRDENSQRLSYYRGWSEDRATRFIDELLLVIRQRRLSPIGGAVDVAAFNQRTYGERRFFTNGLIRGTGEWLTSGAPSQPYHFAIQTSWVEALQRSADGAQVHFVLDLQNVLASGVHQVVSEITSLGDDGFDGLPGKFASLEFASRKARIPLQAADLHVHCWYSEFSRGENMSKERRRVMESLALKRDSMRWVNSEAMDTLVSRLPAEVQAQLHAEVER